MEDEMAAIVQNMKIEVEEVKMEMAEVDIESFGIEQNSWRLAVKDDHDERTDRIIDLQWITEEHNYVKAKSNMEVFEMQGEKIKVEEIWEDCKPFEPMYITEDDILKLEKNDDLIDSTAKIALNSGPQQEIQRHNPEVCKKPRDELYSCYNCNYSTFYKYHLIKHMKLHCSTKFASKKKLDNHAVRKHPDFIGSLSCKMHVCTLCSYKTNLKSRLKNHMLQHYPETRRNFKLRSCSHCKATFKRKTSLDDHTLRKHHHDTSTVTSKIHKCTLCPYKTILKCKLTEHMFQHYPETRGNFNLHSCSYCKATFKSKTSLDNHTLRKHPHDTSTVTSKIHECTFCPYITTLKFNLTKHVLQHYPETRRNFKLRSCSHCKATFKRKTSLDSHTLRKHPHDTSTVTSTIHKCTFCPYITTLKFNLTKHMLQHYPETRRNPKLRSCSYCKATFKRKTSLDSHTLRKHPHDTSTVTSKIHECTFCPYKTTLKFNLTKHMLQHYPERRQNFKLRACSHCKATFKSKLSLDNHTLRKHPHDTSTVTSKIHQCTLCPYKTTLKCNLTTHMLQHYPQTRVTRWNFKLRSCSHCKATFKSKTGLDNHTLRKHPHVTSTVTSKIHKCTFCPYKTTKKFNLTKHMLQHYPERRQNFKLRSCSHCKATFKSKLGLDDHTLRKHPHVTSTVTSKIHKCTLCPYKTTLKCRLTEHMLQHYPKTCSHCKATFKSKLGLDDHTLREHPHVTSTVTSKIYKCTLCPYETAIKYNIDNHMSKQHSQESQVTSTNTRKLKMCNHCDAVFTRRENLDNHIIMKHPEFAASVSRKIHVCKYCTYKTAISCHITKHERKHMLNHLKAPKAHRLKHKSGKCTQCGAAFKSKAGLDEHTIRKHPDFIGFITCKILVCTLCSYKTTLKSSLTRHMSKHSETQESPKPLSSCSQCKVTFKSKQSLDKHICGASVSYRTATKRILIDTYRNTQITNKHRLN